MSALILGLCLFFGLHSLRIYAPLWRLRAIDRWGPGKFKLVYSALSLVGLVLLVHGFGQAKTTDALLWVPPLWTRHLTITLMWPAIVLLVASYMPGNGIKTRLRHPMTLSIKVWALAHLVSNGHTAHVLLFGSMLVWAVLLYRTARQEDRSRMVGLMSKGASWVNLGTLLSVLVGTVVWYWLVFGGGHLLLIGASPWP